MRNKKIHVKNIKCSCGCAVGLRRLVAGLSSRRPGSDSRPGQQRSVVYEVVLGQGFLRVRRSSPVNIIPPMLRTHFHLLCTCCSYQKHEWVSSEDLHQVMSFRTSENTGHGNPTCYFGHRGTLDIVLPLVISDLEEHWTWYSHLLFRISRNTGRGTLTCYFGHRGTLDVVHSLVISDIEEHWTWYSHSVSSSKG